MRWMEAGSRSRGASVCSCSTESAGSSGAIWSSVAGGSLTGGAATVATPVNAIRSTSDSVRRLAVAVRCIGWDGCVLAIRCSSTNAGAAPTEGVVGCADKAAAGRFAGTADTVAGPLGRPDARLGFSATSSCACFSGDDGRPGPVLSDGQQSVAVGAGAVATDSD